MGGTILLSTFGAIRQAKFPFLGTGNRARRVALAEKRDKRCAHLLQNCSTTLPLVPKTPNGGPVGVNKFADGAKILDFSAKSRVSLMTNGGQNAGGGPASTHEILIPCAGLPAPPLQQM